MFSVTKFAIFFTLVASVSSLATPRVRSSHMHHAHAIAARAPAPVPVPVAHEGLAAPARIRKRSRCAAPASSSSSSVAPSSTSSAASDPTPAVAAAPDPNTTSTPPAAPTPTPEPTPTPTPDPSPSPTSSSSPAPTTGGGSGGDVLGSYSGQITFYATGLGACGITNNDSDFIAAAAESMFDGFPGAGDNPNNNPICGKKAQITCNGKTITVTITDRCQACKYGDLDLSPAAFDALADPSVGRTDMTWEMLA